MDFTYDEEQQALREAVRGLVGKSYADFENRRRTVADGPGLRRVAVGPPGGDGRPRAALRRGGRRDGRRTDRGRHRRRGARPRAGPGAVPDLGRAGRRDRGRGRQRRAARRGARRARRGRERAGLRPRRARHPLGADRRGRHRAGRRRRLDAHRGQGAGAARRPRRPARGERRAARRGHRAVPGGRRTPRAWTATGYATHDGGRAARVSFDGTPAVPLGEPVDRTAAIARTLDLARVAACSEAVGAMQVALDATTSYLTSRKQFGVTLNTFQALNFRAADMYVSLELATSLAAWATMVLAAGDDAAVADAASRAGPAGQPRRPARRPGGDPAARRHRR